MTFGSGALKSPHLPPSVETEPLGPGLSSLEEKQEPRGGGTAWEGRDTQGSRIWPWKAKAYFYLESGIGARGREGPMGP